MTPRLRVLLLPAFHSGLNPARIDAVLPRFDSTGWASVRSVIAQVHACLAGITQLGMYEAIPQDAFVDFWQNVWSWIKFLDEYESSLSGDDLLAPDATRYMGFLSLLRFLRYNETVGQLCDSDIDRWMVLGRAWRHFIEAENETAVPGLDDVAYFLGIWVQPNSWNSAAFEQLVRGAGGTRMDLGSLVVSHLKCLIPSPDSAVTQETIIHILSLICVIAGEKITGHNHDPDAPF
ncbi:hypothetical protein C8R45DRAFT_1094828 [Mycena sanguinolenta]|nr:hypothetical protein C8R45DRAFT_1094828 [Mycena sanguinolenta]